MNDLKIFTNDEFGQVRTIVIDNEPWFVGKDVAVALGYSDLNHAITDHVDLEDRVNSKTQGQNVPEFGQRGTWLINESGVYDLIFGSKLESAKRFKRWVTSEVLPAIRNHGIYATDNVIDEILNNPDFGIELLTKLKDERGKRIAAEKKNAVLMHVNKTYTVTEIAKELGLKSAIELNKILADLHIQYKINNTWVMYSDYSNLGYEEIKQEVLDNGTVVYHRRITQIGREFIVNLINEHGKAAC